MLLSPLNIFLLGEMWNFCDFPKFGPFCTELQPKLNDFPKEDNFPPTLIYNRPYWIDYWRTLLNRVRPKRTFSPDNVQRSFGARKWSEKTKMITNSQIWEFLSKKIYPTSRKFSEIHFSKKFSQFRRNSKNVLFDQKFSMKFR